MFVRGVIVLLCVLAAVSDGVREPTCKYPPHMCPLNYSPVCGSDGVTYSNECMLCAANKASKTKILIQKQGECEPPQPNCKYSSDVCPLNYSPVCGSDGKTYSNECELCAANKVSKTKILIQKQGKCEPVQPDMCPLHFSPVCGSDGVTYDNECKLRVANKASKTKIFVQKQGKCDKPIQPDMCPMHYSPVCGSDGKTYGNECMLRVANKVSKTKIFVQKDGECEPVQPDCKYPPNVCPTIYSPVCGSDGKTYSNECELCAANKASKAKILIQKQGECDNRKQPNCKYSSDVCPLNYSPVCGSDGKTYSNECELCAANKASKTKILIQKQGKCEPVQPDMCPMHYSPVCGSDGKTYGNECILRVANKASKTKIFIQKQGECEEDLLA